MVRLRERYDPLGNECILVRASSYWFLNWGEGDYRRRFLYGLNMSVRRVSRKRWLVSLLVY